LPLYKFGRAKRGGSGTL